MTVEGKLTVKVNMTVQKFIWAIAEILSETFAFPELSLESIRAYHELGYNYQEYRHMWE